jgi:AbrB family looped-hinge helix DNA binding protein
METYATSKGQVVIPVELRRKYGISAGTRLEVMDDGERIILIPITPDYIRSIRGSLHGGTSLRVLEQERRLEKDR